MFLQQFKFGVRGYRKVTRVHYYFNKWINCLSMALLNNELFLTRNHFGRINGSSDDTLTRSIWVTTRIISFSYQGFAVSCVVWIRLHHWSKSRCCSVESILQKLSKITVTLSASLVDTSLSDYQWTPQYQSIKAAMCR